MSLTSYRAAPPRAKKFEPQRRHAFLRNARAARTCEWVSNFRNAPAAKPGDDLLFHRLSDSTIGAVWFHGRVRDGIGWVTDAMVTKLWDRRFEVLEIVHLGNGIQRHLAEIKPTFSRAVGDGGTLKREMSN